MFHTSLGAFRSHQVYDVDFPPEHVAPPYSYLGVPSYSVKNLIRKRNASRTGVAPDELLTLEDVRADGGLGSRRMNILEEAHEHEDEVEFIDKALVRRGYEYYTYEAAHEKFVSSVAPNLRDIETFANIPGLGRGLVYRSGYLLSDDPDKLLHILQHVLQVRSIIDIRGFMPLKLETGDSSEALTRQAIFSAYRPFVFDAFLRQWLYLGTGYGEIQRRRILNDADKRLHVMPKAAQDLEVACTNCSIYCFNMGLPASGMPANLQRLFRPVTKVLSHFSPTSLLLEDSRKTMAKLDLTPPEHYIIRLLVSGSVFIKVVLDTLLWAQLPILICSTHGKDRVGLISLLILSILGANNEAILTDYCASEAGLVSFNMTRRLEEIGVGPLLGACRPSTVRRILRFIRSRYGAVDGYLDFIGFDRTCRELLRARLIHSSYPGKLVYKTPASAPFWTENPSILIPAKSLPVIPPIEMFHLNACMRRVLRVVTLLRLRDTFEREAHNQRTGAWLKARRQLRNLKRQRHECTKVILRRSQMVQRKLEHRKRNQPPRLDSCASVSSKSASSVQPPKLLTSEIALTTVNQKLSKVRNGLREILAARKVVLHKLTDALVPLTRSDAVKLLFYRNTQIYAERNERICVRKAPDLYDVYLDQPDLFVRHQARRPQDVVRIVLEHLRTSQQLQTLQTASFRSAQLEAALSDPQRQRNGRDRRKLQRKRAEVQKPRITLVEPEYFFHELCSGLYKPRLSITGNSVGSVHPAQLPPPKTFGQWLMQCWMVPTDAPPMRDPFEETRDECFVPPDILAKYFRMQTRLGRINEPLFSEQPHAAADSRRLIFSEPRTTFKQTLGHARRTRPAADGYRSRPRGSVEHVLFDTLKQHVHAQVPPARKPWCPADRTARPFCKKPSGQPPSPCFEPSRQEPLLPLRYEQFDAVVPPATECGAPALYDANDRDKERQWASLIAASHFTKPFLTRAKEADRTAAVARGFLNAAEVVSSGVQRRDAPSDFLLPNEAPNLYDHMASDLRLLEAKRDYRKRVRWNRNVRGMCKDAEADESMSSVHADSESSVQLSEVSSLGTFERPPSLGFASKEFHASDNLPRHCYVDLFQGARPPGAADDAATGRALLDLGGPLKATELPYGSDADDALDFNSDDERDWLMHGIVENDHVSRWLELAENELVAAGIRQGQKTALAGDLKLSVNRSSVPKFDRYLTEWPANAFGIHEPARDEEQNGVDLYRVRHFTRDLCEGTMMHDAMRLNIY